MDERQLLERLTAAARRTVQLRSFRRLSADDIVQEAWIRMNSAENFRWPERHVRFAALDMVARDARHRASLELPDPKDEASMAGLRLDVERALSRLPDDEAMVAELYGMRGLTFEGVAHQLDMSVTTAWRRWRSGAERLRDDLAVYDPTARAGRGATRDAERTPRISDITGARMKRIG